MYCFLLGNQNVEALEVMHRLLSDGTGPMSLKVMKSLGFIDPGPYWHLTERVLPNHLLYFTVSGKGTLHVEEETLSVHGDMFLLLTAGTCHTFTLDLEEPLKFYPVHFIRYESGDGPEIPTTCLYLPAVNTHSYVNELEAITADWRARQKMKLGFDGARLQLLLGNMYRNLLTRDTSTHGEGEAQIRRIKEYLDRDPTGRYSVAQLAADAGMCRSLFVRRFKQVTGISPSQYVIRNRCLWGRMLIETEGFRIKAAAAACGYPDPYTFSRQFKNVFGLSPSEVRARPTA